MIVKLAVMKIQIASQLRLMDGMVIQRQQVGHVIFSIGMGLREVELKMEIVRRALETRNVLAVNLQPLDCYVRHGFELVLALQTNGRV